jgi:hypothetical protein
MSQYTGGLDHRIGHRAHLRKKIAHAIPLNSLGPAEQVERHSGK